MKINLIHKNIAILWYGKEWASTLRFLQKNWILDYNITIFDKNLDLKIEDFNWKIIVWENYLETIWNYDYIFKSPWISPYTNDLKKYKDKILTQAIIFYEYYKWKIISVTQTKGKSTTTTLIYNLLKNAWYNVKIVWNIWNPVLDEVDIVGESWKGKDERWKEKNEIEKIPLDKGGKGDLDYDFVVYELSSYMLEELTNHHSFISVIWNIYEDHLDWHLGFENYKKAKLNILNNADNLLVWSVLEKDIIKELSWKNYKTFWTTWDYYFKGKDFYVWDKIFAKDISPKIPWEHNLVNFSGVMWVCDILNISPSIFKKTIEEFSGLPHRLQNIWTFSWITFIDDAISTTPESTIEAIKTFWENIWTIFLWWTDRWYSFEKLVLELEKYNIKNLVLFPESSEKIKKLLSKNYNFIETRDMSEAVKFAFKNTWKWKICLLSTASPSYSIWKNFEEKWDLFREEIFAKKEK